MKNTIIPSPSQIFGFDFSKAYEFENGYYLTSAPSRLAKAIAHWELYKKIINLPGHIVECGVFKGASLIRFATYREMLESPYSRKIIGFDAFGSFPDKVAMQHDKEFIESFESNSGTGILKEDLEKVLAKKNFSNVELFKGDILDLLPEYCKNNPQLRIALLHLDVDVYEATKAGLDNLFDKVVTGGLIVLDDYTSVIGGTQAVDDFLEERNLKISIQKMPYYMYPSYIIKP